MKVCRYCDEAKPLREFYIDRRGIPSARCRKCHGLASRICAVCGTAFIGKPGTKACSSECRKAMRSPTYANCPKCGQRFGPISHLNRKYCSVKCKTAAQRTGRRTFRKTVRKARRAQSLVRYHVLAGLLMRPDICEECGVANRRIEAAHYNYDQPLKVRWLCRSCHVRWDKREPKNGTVVVARAGDFAGTTLEAGVTETAPTDAGAVEEVQV